MQTCDRCDEMVAEDAAVVVNPNGVNAGERLTVHARFCEIPGDVRQS